MSFSSVHAQEVAYRIDWGAPNGHYFDVQMRFQNPEQGPVSVRIPAWRPGRYEIQNFARNIVRFSATDSEGGAIGFKKTDKDTWEVDAQPGQEIVVSYSAYSRNMDAGSSYLDDAQAYINPITLLMYVPGQELLPTTLSVKQPAGWKSATQLSFDATKGVYSAANYHELVDAPIIISPTLELLSFEFAGATFQVAIQSSPDLDLDREKLLVDLQKVVEVQVNLMGVIPFDRYVFLYHFLDTSMDEAPHDSVVRRASGVEHKNSTSIVMGPWYQPNFLDHVLSISAHELFHAWNVERIRPEEIYLPDYSSEQYATTFWIYEGITAYYTSLSMMRAGLISEDQFLRQLAGSIRSFESAPGRDVTSVAMSSFDSWVKGEDAPPNTYYSFYTAGQVMGLLLDMEVRGRTRNRESLDSVMRYLYQEYAARNQGVPEDGLQRAIETITSGTMQPFFDAYVFGTEPIDYDRYLYHAGYRLAIGTDPQKPAATLGLTLKGDDVAVVGNVVPGSGAFTAGLDLGDEILAIDGARVTGSSVSRILAKYNAGDTVEVAYFRRNQLRKTNVVLADGGNTTYELVRLPDTSILQNQTRRDWMNLSAG